MEYIGVTKDGDLLGKYIYNNLDHYNLSYSMTTFELPDGSEKTTFGLDSIEMVPHPNN
jgi:hypothetical protein